MRRVLVIETKVSRQRRPSSPRFAADLPLFDADADVAFGVVGVERDVGAIEHAQEFALDGEQRVENGVERGKAGGSGVENAIEAGSQSATAGRVDAAGLGVLLSTR